MENWLTRLWRRFDNDLLAVTFPMIPVALFMIDVAFLLVISIAHMYWGRLKVFNFGRLANYDSF